MDRVNHSTVLKPAFFAIPALLFIVSLCQADVPRTQRDPANSGIQQAVGVGGSETGVIQQVVGKQPKPRKARPGLLEVLTGSKDKGDQNHQHENMPKHESRGLLNVLFNSDSKSASVNKNSSKSTRKTESSSRGSGNSSGQPKKDYSLSMEVNGVGVGLALSKKKTSSSANTSQKSNSVNWDGIPYHSASAVRQSTDPEPIRDPEVGAVAGNNGTRIIRGGSRTIVAQPASSRQARQTNSGQAAISTLAVPQPPQDIEPIPAAVSQFSNTSSSRRSSRRTIQPLEPSTMKQAATASLPKKMETKKADTFGDVDDLVPRVSRRDVSERVAETEASVNAAPKEVTPRVDVVVPEKVGNAPKVVAVPAVPKPGEPQAVPRKPFVAPRQVPRQDVAIREPTLPQPPADRIESGTAVAAIGAPLAAIPTIAAEPSTDSTANAATSSLPVPVSPSLLRRQQSADTVQPKIVDSPTVATFSKIASQPVAPHQSKFPQPVLAPETDLTWQPSYTTPVDPAVQSKLRPALAPATALPAATASHRAGPPSIAFRSTGVNSQGSSFSAASTPVGSGVAASEVASLRTTGRGPGYPADPYALQADTNAGITKSPTPSAGLRSAFASQPTNATSAGSNVPNPNRIADNFTASTDSKNRMRASDRLADATNSTSELPGIRVATFGPSEVMIRQMNEFEIRVENRGAIDAMGVIVRAEIPNWADMKGQNATSGNVIAESQGNVEHLVWTIDRLPAGSSEKMFIRLIAARSGSYGLDVNWTMQPQKSVAKIRVHEPRLKLTIEGPDQVVYGKSQTYKVRVLNPGDGTAPNVVFTLSPNSATPQTQRIGDIPAGKEAQFDVELTAQDLGDLKIHGLASGDLELRSESSKTIRVAAANLEAVLSGPQLKYQHTEAMYSLQLQNNGAATSDKIVATLRLPAGVKYLGGIDGAVTEGNVLKWKLDSLAPGVMRNYQFQCQMATTGEHEFAFDCVGTAAGSADVSIATRVESIADLVLIVADPPAPAPIGTDVTYEILVRNRGSKEATNVRAVAQFGHGIEPQRIEGQSGEVMPGQVMFDAIPRIGPGAEIRLRVIAQAEKPGHHRFRAEVHSGDTMLVAEEATHYMSSQGERVSRRSNEAGSR
ncbi:MAG: hypothetical protein OSA98_08330 [Rubripirellula sp.]|nr:hypothetical protein [Rubripirellula sp.]